MQNKPFWIWDVLEHKHEDIKTIGNCCFNHIIGLPTKGSNDSNEYDKKSNKPDYDEDEYQLENEQQEQTGEITNHIF